MDYIVYVLIDEYTFLLRNSAEIRQLIELKVNIAQLPT